MKILTLLGVMILLCHYLSAQLTKPLTVGDSLPGAAYTYLDQQDVPSSKPTIIEFFATYCSTCLQSMPRLNELQKGFAGKINIILATEESKEKVTALFNKPFLKQVSLPVISNDTLLKKYLPYTSVPHVVWIDGSGKIAAITNSEAVTASNIEKLVSGAFLRLPVKNSSFDYDPQKPLPMQVSEGSTIYFQSATAGYIHNAKSNVYGSITIENGLEKNYFINMKLINLLQIALGRISLNRFIIQTKNAEDLLLPDSADKSSKLYSYEITHPKTYHKPTYLRQLFNDLGTVSGLDIKYEPVTVDCYVLQKKGANTSLKTKGGRPSLLLPKINHPQLALTNKTISRLIKVLNAGGMDRPIVIDETGIQYPVDLFIKTSTLKDFASLNKGLLPYGLTLQKSRRTTAMVIIRDADTVRYLSPQNESL